MGLVDVQRNAVQDLTPSPVGGNAAFQILTWQTGEH